MRFATTYALKVIIVLSTTFSAYVLSSPYSSQGAPTPTIKPSENPSTPSPETSALANPPNLTEQITLLEAQNRLLKEHYQSLMSVIQWALSFAAIFLLAILGLIGYFSYRRYENDKETLQNMIKNETLRLRADLSAGRTDWERAAASARTNWERTAADTQSKKLASIESSIAGRIKEATAQATTPIMGRMQSLQFDLERLTIDVLGQEAEKWEREGVAENAIRQHIKIAQKAHETGRGSYAWKVTDALQDIVRLRSKFPSGTLALNLEADEIAFLQSLPAHFGPLVQKILGKQ